MRVHTQEKKEGVSLNMSSLEIGQRIWLGFNKNELGVLNIAQSPGDCRFPCYL